MTGHFCDAPMLLVDRDSANGDLGARFRRTRPGPELDLVESFLRAMPFDIPEGCLATVFREPRLESGFPDLVIVIWREGITRDWRSERVSLEARDLRLMHFLHHAQSVQEVDLLECFGRPATASIRRLQDAAMIRPVGSAWGPCALGQSFAALSIIAIEAKVGKWATVLNQALLNTWFASKSYVLVPHIPSPSQIAEARQLGIGVWSLGDRGVEEVEAESMQLPKSYASWMLNEWAWRSAQGVRSELK